jgi:uncharacterized protein (TIGR02246 family)
MTTELQAEQAVQDLLLKLREAWDRGDGEAYAAVFSDDAQYVNAPGERVYGRKAIAESHQHVFDTIFKGSKLGRNYPRRFRQISPDVILVESSGSVLFPGESEDRIPPNGLLTMVIARHNDAWRIVSFQNTPTGRMRKVKFIGRYLRSRFARS